MRKALIDLASENPVWALPAQSFEMLREAFGAGWEVKTVPPSPSNEKSRFSGSIDPANIYEGAEVYFGWGIPRKVISAALETLKWVHSGAAGVGASITEEFAWYSRRTCFGLGDRRHRFLCARFPRGGGGAEGLLLGQTGHNGFRCWLN